MKREVWKWEYTDTFGGEANYSWVRRGEVSTPEGASDTATLRAVKRDAGLAGMRGRAKQYGGDTGGAFYPYRCTTVLFWTFDRHEETTP